MDAIAALAAQYADDSDDDADGAVSRGTAHSNGGTATGSSDDDENGIDAHSVKRARRGGDSDVVAVATTTGRVDASWCGSFPCSLYAAPATSGPVCTHHKHHT